jgi:hypothetical protein
MVKGSDVMGVQVTVCAEAARLPKENAVARVITIIAGIRIGSSSSGWLVVFP